MMKYIVMLILLLFFKGCYRCNDKTYYSVEEDEIKSEQLHTNKLSEISLSDKEFNFFIINMFIIAIKWNLRIKLEKLYTYNTIFNHSINNTIF